jgi:hypothetical protein
MWRGDVWSPTDWLSTFAPTEIDREYKGDLSCFSGIELVYAYGEDGRRDESALRLL